MARIKLSKRPGQATPKGCATSATVGKPRAITGDFRPSKSRFNPTDLALWTCDRRPSILGDTRPSAIADFGLALTRIWSDGGCIWIRDRDDG
ncbi:hypothetical protein NL676_034081 [Syzygium grande]|nr:hypothetical protein NL676_034081 [Syzygium grande]